MSVSHTPRHCQGLFWLRDPFLRHLVLGTISGLNLPRGPRPFPGQWVRALKPVVQEQPAVLGRSVETGRLFP